MIPVYRLGEITVERKEGGVTHMIKSVNGEGTAVVIKDTKCLELEYRHLMIWA